MGSCTLCELHKTCRSVKIEPDGSGPVVFMGEAPGGDEDLRGKPFVGRSGSFLRKMVELLGLDPSEVRYTNAVRCRPPGNATPKKSHLKACLGHLQEEFAKNPPSVVIPLGNAALDALRLLGWLKVPGKITALNSQPIETEGPTVYPLFHPAYILRNETMLEAYGQSFDGLERLIREGVQPKTPTRYEMSDKLEDLARALERAKAAGTVAYDIETSTLNPSAPGARFVSFALSWEECQAFGFWLTSENYDAALAMLHDELLEDQDVVKVIHNAKFELGWSMSLGRMIFNFDDTILFHWHLQEKNGTHSLKVLAPAYTDMGFYDAELEAYKAKHPEGDPQKTYKNEAGEKVPGSYANIPREILLPYNCMDVDATIRVHKIFKPRLTEAQLKVYRDVQVYAAYALADMEITGCQIDWNQASYIGRELDAEAKRIREELLALPVVAKLDAQLREIPKRKKRPFNPGSDDDIRILLFQVLRLPVLYKTDGGKPSVEKEVLTALAPKHPIAAVILRLRTVSKINSTYVKGFFKRRFFERIHTTYGSVHTETGRYNSSGPNLQNIPRNPLVIEKPDGSKITLAIKSMYVPDEITDWLVQADYSQVELRIMAMQSGDETLLNYFRQGFDVHRYVAARIHRVEPAQISDEQRTMAKRTVFGLIYGQSSGGLAEELRISEREAEDFLAKFFVEFPRVKRWMDAIERKVRKTGQVETMFGRIRRLPDAMGRDEILRSRALRQAINAPIQGTAADILADKKGELWFDMQAKGMRTRQVLTVHDSILFNVPDEELVSFMLYAKAIMEDFTHLPWVTIPVVADFEFGKRWSQMKKLKDDDFTKMKKDPSAWRGLNSGLRLGE